MKNATSLALWGFAALLTLTLAPNARAQTTDLAWEPERPVEFVITTSPGGGSDLYARFITSVVNKLEVWDQQLLPANHPGGSGAVAFNYLFDKEGDPHFIMITLNSIITTPLIQGDELPFTYQDFTPISLLALDPFFLWVPADSPLESVDDFLAEAKSRSMTVGGTGSKQEDQTLFTMIQSTADTMDFAYVPFDGGSKVAAALIGAQLEASVNNPSEQVQYMEAGRSRALCAFLDERSASFPDVPTCKEEGLDLTYFNMRSIMAAPGITDQQQQGLAQAMELVYDSQEWQDFVKTNGLEAQYMAPQEFSEFLDGFAKMHEEILTEAGWIGG